MITTRFLCLVIFIQNSENSNVCQKSNVNFSYKIYLVAFESGLIISLLILIARVQGFVVAESNRAQDKTLSV